MAMTPGQVALHATYGNKGNDLQDAITNFASKAAALAAANAAAVAAQTTLDAAYVAFVNAGGEFKGAFVLPTGYTPPTP